MAVFYYVHRLAKEVYGTAVPNQDLNLNQDLFLLYARGNTRMTGNQIGGHDRGNSAARAATAAVNVTAGSGSATMTASLLCIFISSIALFLKV